jgi:hypothetical protein
VKASLNEMAFEGSGKSKKEAKLNASKALLVHLVLVFFCPDPNGEHPYPDCLYF